MHSAHVVERLLEWKSESDVDGEEVGPVRIVDADDPDIIYEELTWMTRRDAEKLAEQLGHEFTEV